MKRNNKFYKQKKLRQELIDYLEYNRAKEHYSDNWTPGEPKNVEIKKMIKAKIGSGNMMSKGARKWDAVNQKLSHKRERYEKIDIEDEDNEFNNLLKNDLI